MKKKVHQQKSELKLKIVHFHKEIKKSNENFNVSFLQYFCSFNTCHLFSTRKIQIQSQNSIPFSFINNSRIRQMHSCNMKRT